MILCDVDTLGPLGFVKQFSIFLEVEGKRYRLEIVYKKEDAKNIVSKWQVYANKLGLPFVETEDAKRFAS